MDIKALLEKVSEYLPEDKLAVIEDAYRLMRSPSLLPSYTMSLKTVGCLSLRSRTDLGLR